MGAWALTMRPAAAGSCIMLGVLAISAGLVLRSLTRSATSRREELYIKSPRTLLPGLSAEKIVALPYDPSIIPGGRDVLTPYGVIKVFEWGPEDGEKVLLMHGISTPCLALANLAEELVGRGYRVMLFDFFGRGYSDTPTDVRYDIRLYTTQILLVLASSSLPWTGDDGFHLVGYSLGGGIAVSFAQYFPHMVRSLVLVAGGGLIRPEHVSWQSKILYSTAGIIPERVLEYLVRRRITPAESTVTNEVKMAGEVVDVKQTTRSRNSDASGGDSYDNAVLRPGITVSAVMKWQLRHHAGFVPAFMSSIRYAPIYDRKDDWLALGQLLDVRRGARAGSEWSSANGPPPPGLRGGRLLFVLGATDPVIVQEELMHDATGLLGEEGFEAVLLDCGHEIVMTKGKEVADVAVSFWNNV
ncbi:alpha/beta-hydrolase [Apodospora peruviana]|uniref:Alpha/beta-hydrolase n=1 Tax=Apodospora peruviana TaxID=516989 RepID=A0AAE0IST7_9PEZI|nr:alpha/beta-hydrolase [Apodospora peruviana]